METIAAFTKDYFIKLHTVIDSLDHRVLVSLIRLLWKAYERNSTIFFMGNGGSAATASHLALDIGNNTVMDRKNYKEKRFRTMALTDNTSWITALANDISYEDIFVEQLKNFLKRGDFVIAISGSGNSPNVVKAISFAKSRGATTVGILGFNGGKLAKMVKLAVLVPIKHYGYVEGIHSEIHHYIVEALKLLKKGK